MKNAIPSHKSQIARLRRIRGQVDGIERMIEDRRYCPDIITQIHATRAALKALETSILSTHMRNCVLNATQSSKKEQNQKIEELLNIMKRSSQ